MKKIELRQIIREEIQSMKKSKLRENVNPKFEISKYKKEALSALNNFADKLESEGMFEFIPDLENYEIDPQTNSIHIEEFGSVYLVPNEGPIPNELKEYMSESGNGEINEDGASWKKYPKNGYYYIVVF